MVGGSKLSLEIKAHSVSESSFLSCRWDQGKDAWVELQGLQHWQQELEGGDHRLMLVDWYSPACKGCETAFPALTQVARDEELKRWVALLESAGRWRGVEQVTAHWAPHGTRARSQILQIAPTPSQEKLAQGSAAWLTKPLLQPAKLNIKGGKHVLAGSAYSYLGLSSASTHQQGPRRARNGYHGRTWQRAH